MKLLWESNAPWAGTGYGQQTRLLLSALREQGHDVSCFAFYGLSGGMVEFDGYPVYPNSDFDAWGNDVIKVHIERSKSKCVVTLMDLFVLNADIWSQLPVPWFAWTPLDSVGVGATTLKLLKLVDFPIAMSEFGASQMRAYDVEPFATIYHAVDTDVYKPMDKMEQRAHLGIEPDVDYLIGMVMANKGDRKQYPLHLEAIKRFMDNHPDEKIRIYIHTEPTHMMGGWDMRELVERLGLKGMVYSTNQYDTSVVPMSEDFMARIFNSFDVLMNCSAGEGFGIPIIEAQACEVPVITHGVTAMPEITWNGYCVESASKGLASHYGWQFAPSVEDMAYRLECVYRMGSTQRNKMGRQAVIDKCSLPVIASQWSEMFEGLEEAQVKAVAEARIAL
jgi:glycosyltransferase involved in cell wall biosynthesis